MIGETLTVVSAVLSGMSGKSGKSAPRRGKGKQSRVPRATHHFAPDELVRFWRSSRWTDEQIDAELIRLGYKK